MNAVQPVLAAVLWLLLTIYCCLVCMIGFLFNDNKCVKHNPDACGIYRFILKVNRRADVLMNS